MLDMGSAPLDSQLRAQVADKRSGGAGGARAGEDAKWKKRLGGPFPPCARSSLCVVKEIL